MNNNITKGKRVFIVIGIIIILLVITLGIPAIIDFIYLVGSKMENPHATNYKANDLLNFWGVFMAFISSTSLGAVALFQSIKSNAINDRLLKIEEGRQCPIIDFSYIYPESNEVDKKFIELFLLDNNDCPTIRVNLKNKSEALARKCLLKQADLYCTNKKYVLDVDKFNNIFDTRAILPNDNFYYQFDCREDNNSNDIDKNNKFFEDASPSSQIVNGKTIKYTDGMYILEMIFLSIDVNGIEHKQRLWCFFKKYSSNENFSMLNRIIEFL